MPAMALHMACHPLAAGIVAHEQWAFEGFPSGDAPAGLAAPDAATATVCLAAFREMVGNPNAPMSAMMAARLGLLRVLLAATAEALGPDLARVRLWSVSIDPDQDTPERLATYAAAFDAPPRWRFLTGPAASVRAVRDAYDALDDIKMAHRPVTLLRLRGHLWARFEGDMSPATLTRETRATLIGA